MGRVGIVPLLEPLPDLLPTQSAPVTMSSDVAQALSEQNDRFASGLSRTAMNNTSSVCFFRSETDKSERPVVRDGAPTLRSLGSILLTEFGYVYENWLRFKCAKCTDELLLVQLVAQIQRIIRAIQRKCMKPRARRERDVL